MPKRPRFAALYAWLSDKYGEDVLLGQDCWPLIGKAAADAPTAVAAEAAKQVRWRAERDSWAVRQPVDFNPTADEWRMFGGAWMPSYLTVTDGKATVIARHAASRLARRADEAEVRAWAARLYEWTAMHKAGSAWLFEAAS